VITEISEQLKKHTLKL